MTNATVSGIRAGLATRLATISGLRVSATIPDQPNPPQAVVSLDSIDYDKAFNRGHDEYRWTVTLVIGRVSERTAQDRMDTYLAPSGASSIKTAIEADQSLGGAAVAVRVTSVVGVQSVTVGDITYLAANVAVLVYA